MTLSTGQGRPRITDEAARRLAFAIVVVAAMALKIAAYAMVHDRGTLAYHILSLAIRVGIYVVCCAIPALVVGLLMKSRVRASATTFAIAFLLACSIDVAVAVSNAMWTVVYATHYDNPISAEYTIDGKRYVTFEAGKIAFKGDTIKAYVFNSAHPSSVIAGASSIRILEWTRVKEDASPNDFVHVSYNQQGNRYTINNSRKVRHCGGSLKLYRYSTDDNWEPMKVVEGVSDIAVVKGPFISDPLSAPSFSRSINTPLPVVNQTDIFHKSFDPKAYIPLTGRNFAVPSDSGNWSLLCDKVKWIRFVYEDQTEQEFHISKLKKPDGSARWMIVPTNGRPLLGQGVGTER